MGRYLWHYLTSTYGLGSWSGASQSMLRLISLSADAITDVEVLLLSSHQWSQVGSLVETFEEAYTAAISCAGILLGNYYQRLTKSA